MKTMTAAEAIERSTQHNEIVTVPYTPEAAEALAAACDDSVDNDPVTEYWGQDDDGAAWRVHLVVESR